RASAVCGPSHNRSASPSFAATWTYWDAMKPLRICIIRASEAGPGSRVIEYWADTAALLSAEEIPEPPGEALVQPQVVAVQIGGERLEQRPELLGIGGAPTAPPAEL